MLQKIFGGLADKARRYVKKGIPMIKGKLCILRPICPKDLEMIRQWRLSEFVQSKFPSWDAITPASQESWYQSISGSAQCCYFLITDLKGAGVGVIYLVQIDRRNRHAEFGYYIGEPLALNSGIAIGAEFLILDYAFGYLNLKKVWCETMDYNKPVIRVHERFGFKHDGVLRSHAFRHGEFQNLVLMSILDEEFKDSKKNIVKILEGLSDR